MHQPIELGREKFTIQYTLQTLGMGIQTKAISVPPRSFTDRDKFSIWHRFVPPRAFANCDDKFIKQHRCVPPRSFNNCNNKFPNWHKCIPLRSFTNHDKITICHSYTLPGSFTTVINFTIWYTVHIITQLSTPG